MSSKSLILFSALVSLCLTYYSYNMSQNSAFVVGKDITEQNKTDDTATVAKLEANYKSTIATIQQRYDKTYQRNIDPFEEQIANVTKSYDNQIKVIQDQINVINANTSKTNYLYADKQKRPKVAEMKKLEMQKLAVLSPILSRKEKAISEAKINRFQLTEDARNQYIADKASTKAQTKKGNAIATKTGDLFSFLFSKISGWAIFIALFLTTMREILFHRNGIEPEPILSNFDFSPWWVVEVLSFPVAWIRNHSVHEIRKKYKALPDPMKPQIHEEIWDGKSLDQNVIEPSQKELSMPLRTNDDEIEIPIEGLYPDPILEEEKARIEERENNLDALAEELQEQKREQEQKENELRTIAEKAAKDKEQARLQLLLAKQKEQEQIQKLQQEQIARAQEQKAAEARKKQEQEQKSRQEQIAREQEQKRLRTAKLKQEQEQKLRQEQIAREQEQQRLRTAKLKQEQEQKLRQEQIAREQEQKAAEARRKQKQEQKLQREQIAQEQEQKRLRTAKLKQEQEQLLKKEAESVLEKKEVVPKKKSVLKDKVGEAIALARKQSKKGLSDVLIGKGKARTIEHVSKNKEDAIEKKYYLRTEVVSLVGKYKKRVATAIDLNEEGSKDQVIKNNQRWVDYWENRLLEFDIE